MADNTLFLRLDGPMQSWGTGSRFQLRRTAMIPSKSGVLGLLLCARGIRREDSRDYLDELVSTIMGVRLDRPGTVGRDYHTAGAKIGIRTPEGKIKKTAGTEVYETLLSQRQYLYDASFLIALQGDSRLLGLYAAALREPVWPPYLGRKSCIPSRPVFSGTGQFDTLIEALESQPRLHSISRSGRDGSGQEASVECECWLEHVEDTPPPSGSRKVYDVPRQFGFWNYGARWVVRSTVTVGVTCRPPLPQTSWKDPYAPPWPKLKAERLAVDNHLCVFCKSPAEQVHHTDYDDVRVETLRSLCGLCHDACTMLEYSRGDHPRRVDPLDPARRNDLLQQVNRILAGRRKGRRRELLQGQ